MEQYKLPIEPQKLFSTPTHFHAKKAFKNQFDILNLANMGDEKAILLRNILAVTMVNANLTTDEKTVLRYFITGRYQKAVVACFIQKTVDDVDKIATQTLDRMRDTFQNLMAS